MELRGWRPVRSAVVALLVLSVAMVAFAVMGVPAPDTAAAVVCNHGDTRWRPTSTCCSPCNTRLYKLQWCNGGSWDDTGVIDCYVYPDCCTYPCCY